MVNSKNQENNSSTDSFSAISHKTRRNILYLINEKKETTLTELAKKINQSIPLTQKHVNQLYHANLIDKSNKIIKNGFKKQQTTIIHLTHYGRYFLKHLESMEFFEKNKEYFQTHTLDYLPEYFIEGIHALKNVKKITSLPMHVELTKKLLTEHTKTFVKIAYDQILIDLYRFVMSVIKKGNFQVSYVMSLDANIPEQFLEAYKEVDENSLVRQGRMKRRMISNTHVIVCVSDNAAFLMLPLKSGMSDTNIMFYDEHNQEFQDWCNDLLDYLWNNADTFVESKIPIQKESCF